MTIDPSMLEAAVRSHLNLVAPRTMVVLEPLKVNIVNFPGEKVARLNVPDFPDFPEKSSHTITFAKTVYIESSDFKFESDKNFRRLTKDQSVGLRHAGYVITFSKIVAKNSTGQVTEIDVECCPVDKVDKKPKAFIHWVCDPVSVEVRLYERLFKHKNPEDSNEVPDGFLSDINENSLTVLNTALADKHLSGAKVFEKFQFERSGFFSVDPDTAVLGKLIFNRTVSLKEDSGK
jgi:glutaminyl-tRNA synthetase